MCYLSANIYLSMFIYIIISTDYNALSHDLGGAGKIIFLSSLILLNRS